MSGPSGSSAGNSPWSDGSPPRNPSERSSQRTLSMGMTLVLLAAGFGAGVLLTWIVQWATLADKERERSQAVANLTQLSTKVADAEKSERESKNSADEMRKKMADASRQADEASRQLGAARSDASSVRAERDEARATATTAKAELDKWRSAESNPVALPTADLSKAIGAIKTFRCTAMVSLRTPAPGLDDVAARSALSQSLTTAGLACSDQSPVELLALVSLSEDQPRRALAVMLLVTRVVKVPGESLSRQVSLWGQQRSSSVTDASASTQVAALIKELVDTMKTDLAPAGAPSSTATQPATVTPVSTPPSATAPTSPTPASPTPASTTPASTTPGAIPPANAKP